MPTSSAGPYETGMAGSNALPHMASQWQADWADLPQQSPSWCIPWLAIEAICIGMPWFAMSEVSANDVTGWNSANSNHANSAIARTEREAKKVRMESDECMVSKLSPEDHLAQPAPAYFTAVAWV